MSQTSTSPLDKHREQIELWIGRNEPNAYIVTELNRRFNLATSDRSLRRALKRWGLQRPGNVEQPGVRIKDDEATAVSAPSFAFTTPEELMAERGLSTEDWEVSSVTVNEWDSPTGETLHQLKAHLHRIKPISLILPARPDGPTFKVHKPKVGRQEPKRVVFVGDQQAPYHNVALHTLFCEFLLDFKPHEGVLIGDTIDLPDISRHPNNPEHDKATQECIDAGYLVLRDYRIAHPDTYWRKLAGNHDERLRRALINRLNEIYGLRRAEVPGEGPEDPVVDVAHLLRLDELGIEYIRPTGDYEHMQINVSTHLAARHGWIARKGSGSSALATLEHLGFSVVVGHTHRQSLVHKTRHDINGGLSTLAACETGCMCRIEDGLGYAVAPDWQNGFATASIWPDGTFKIDVATFVNDTLLYRDRRYR